MRYDQSMCYLELREREEKLSGAGYAKVECWEGNCKILLQISGVKNVLDGFHEVELRGGKNRIGIGKVELQEGRGRLELRGLNADNVWGSGLQAGEIEEIRVSLPNGLEIYGKLGGRKEAAGAGSGPGRTKEQGMTDTVSEPVWTNGQGMKGINSSGFRKPEGQETGTVDGRGQEDQGRVEENQGRVEEDQGRVEENQGRWQENQGLGQENQVQVQEKQARIQENQGRGQENQGRVEENQSRTQENQGLGMENQETGMGISLQGMQENEKRMQEPHMPIKAGKWEQLDAIYPHIVPFGDRRRYLQISPGDFVILKEKSYRKVNNSFLLHGYFTYKHLILCKMLRKGEMAYYVGVPGRFFDREKEVAILFGFESFEGGVEPAKEGDFGYYLMRVEL